MRFSLNCTLPVSSRLALVVVFAVWVNSLPHLVYSKAFTTPVKPISSNNHKPKPAGANEAISVPRKKATENYGKVPLSFESNQGQTAPEVRFFSRGPGYGFYLTPSKDGILIYNFTPVSQNYSDLTGNQVANFSFTNSTKVALFPVGDAYVEDGGNAGANFGSVTPLLVKTANQTGQRRDVYLKYDLSTLSRKITSAKLRIFAGLSIAIVVSLVVAASVFVQQQLARNNDRAEASQATQGNGDVPSLRRVGRRCCSTILMVWSLSGRS